MKSTMKKLGLLLAVMIMAILFTVSASALTDGYYTYYLHENGTAGIIDVDTNISGDITIPTFLGGYKVTSINGNAFADCVNLKKVTFSGNLEYVDLNAFENCNNLEEIFISGNLQYINSSAFRGCHLKKMTIDLKALSSDIKLPPAENVIITDKLESFYGLSFDCFWSYQIKNIEVWESNPNFLSENGVLFNKDKTKLIWYLYSKPETEYIIPDSVETICEFAFSYTPLTNVILPSGLKNIESHAFYYTLLNTLSIPNGVEKIAEHAFFAHILTDVYFDGTKSEWEKVEEVKDASFWGAVTMHFKEEIVDPVPPEEPEEPDVPDVPITPIEPEEPKPEDHEHFYDDDEDETCNICGYDRTENCDCRCHNDNFFAKIIWSITNFFNKIFKKNKICACGIAHY